MARVHIALWLVCAPALLASVSLPAPAIAAEPKTVRLGALEISYNAERWRVDNLNADGFTMWPIGMLDRKLDPAHIRRSEGTGFDACATLARAQLALRNYSERLIAPATVAGLPAVRLEGGTGCRNATPKGIAVCTHFAGSAYLFSAGNGNCRGGGVNLFSGIDPLEELLDGVRFVP